MSLETDVYGRIEHGNGNRTIFMPCGPSKSDKRALFRRPLPRVLDSEVLSALRSSSLPLRGSIGEVVGHGGWSVAVRVDGANGKRYVAVAKPMAEKTALPHEDDPRIDMEIKKVVENAMVDYAIPVMRVIARGPEDVPTLLKISQEIKGDPLSDINILHRLSSLRFVENLLGFFSAVTDLHSKEGVLVDLGGRMKRNRILTLLQLASPFIASNVLIETGTDNVKLVDVSIWRGFSHASISLKEKAVMTLRRLALESGMLLLKGARFAHRVRNSIFQESVVKDSIRS